MKKLSSQKVKLLSVLCMAMLVPLGLGVAMLNASAETTAFDIVEGAGVRLPKVANEDTTGIRFTAQLSKTEFETITKDETDPVYFGIEITANGKSNDICYLVDDKSKITTAEQEIDFGTDNTYEYYAAILYNEEELKSDLALNATYNPDYDASKTDEENIEAFSEELLQKYLYAAYRTELTARAYYQIGETKTYGESTTTRSIWGVATAAYLDKPTDYAVLTPKYFTVGQSVSVNVVYETGEIVYNGFADTDMVYYDTQLLSLTDGKMAKSLYADKALGDTMQFAVVSANGTLTTLNGTLITNAKTVATQAYYDAAADTMYYTDEDGKEKTLAGSAEASFSYVVDATTSYALADYTSGSLVSNVNYKYADSVSFLFSGLKITDEERGLVGGLNPRIITASNDNGYVEAFIDYNPQTDVYTGVTLSIDTADGMYTFTDAVIISQMIDDATELDTVFNQADKTTNNNANLSYYVKGSKYGTITKGVYMLANDIDCSTGFTFDNSAFNYFEGVFDGRGHNIYNLDVSGTESNPGNGLFSALSTYSAIQNVGFINVKANYGSVFQGNLFDVRLSASTTIGTYAASDIRTAASGVTNSERTHGSTYYRAQMGIPTDDLTTPMSAYLKSSSRRSSDLRFATIWQNVYVQVDPSTVRLMGVISRNMPARQNNLNANNLVIEYQPKTPYDTAEGANDGALPYGYDYTNGVYGVLFGGAYDTAYIYNGGSFNRYDVPAGYMSADDVGVTRNYYTPTATYVNSPYSNASLLFHDSSQLTNGSWFNNRIYVISEVGLVSSVSGSILGTNETKTSDTQLQFYASKSYYYVADGYKTPDAEHLNEKYKLERYNSYEDAAKAGYTTNAQLTSYMLDNGAEENYWDISKGYLQWKNVKATN